MRVEWVTNQLLARNFIISCRSDQNEGVELFFSTVL